MWNCEPTGLPNQIFKASALWADAFYKSKCPSVCPSVCPCVCPSVCSLLTYPLTVFLPRSRMSNIVRDSESLGKSNEKKWSYIWTFLFGSGLKTFLSFCVLDDFFRFSKKLGFGAFLVHPTMALVLLCSSVERCFVSRMLDFSCYISIQVQLIVKGSSWQHIQE